MIRAAVLVATALFCASAQRGPAHRFPNAVAVSGLSPFPEFCDGAQSGRHFRNSAVETWLTADLRDPLHLVGVWQQDRWSNGGASGVLAAASFDGGMSWKTSMPAFSTCASGASGFARASDPWVSISPDGTVHMISLSLNGPSNTHAMQASRSRDGGLTWSEPIVLRRDQGADILNDKNSLTADPHDPNYVYAVWDRLTGLTSTVANNFRGPTWFARTTDGGETWEAARQIFDAGANAQTIANQIVVLPDGTVVDGFVWIQNATAPLVRDERPQLALVRSLDRGLTWSPPIVIGAPQPVGVSDVKTGVPVRSGALIPSFAVDPVSGAMYCVWQDGRFSGGKREGIAFSRSTDGGLNWTAPAQVNQVPDVQAFLPVIAVDSRGRLAVLYYDFRKDTDDRATLLATCWRLLSSDGGQTWTESAASEPFDLAAAPLTTGGYFVGDYQGIAAAGDRFVSFFVASAAGDVSSAVFAAGRPAAVDRSSTGRKEVNRYVLRREIGAAKRK